MLFSLLSAASAAPGYLRTPDLHGDLVVFTADDDLWTASVQGGPARRLTAHPGIERRPRFSPDGRWIAFTGEYDGNTDVFVIPTGGGEPARLTWHPAVDEVVGWSGDTVIFRSTRLEPHGRWEIYTVPSSGGDPTMVPIGWAGWLDVDPKNGRYAFNRSGREAATWKRYRGGSASDIWVGDATNTTFSKITSFAGMDGYPMWHDGRLYFLTDEGGTAEIWSTKPDGSERTRLTRHADWDARWPAMGDDGRIVYMLGGDLWLFDPKSGSDRKLEIELAAERTLTRTRYPDPVAQLRWWEVSPDGDRLLVATRGELWSVPTKDGVSLPITHDSGPRESWGAFSPDGTRVVYVTDASGEEALAVRDAWGRGEEKVIVPAGATGWHFAPSWSPDGRRVAWGDETQTVWVAEVEGGKVTKVDHAEQAEISDYRWSPDGRFLAYTKADRRSYTAVWVWDTKDAVARAVTGPYTSDHSPEWDPQGRYLYFLGDRTVDPVLGSRDFDYVLTKTTRPFVIPLKADTRDPFVEIAGLPPVADKDEKKKEKKDKKQDKDAPEEADEKPAPVVIDWDGIAARAVAFPVPAGNYAGLRATDTKLFWLSYPTVGLASRDEAKSSLESWDLEARKAAPYLDDVGSYELSGDGTRIVVSRANEFYALDPAAAPDAGSFGESRVDLSHIRIALDPRAEWRQIYFEAWRHMRDFDWDPELGGLDWVAVRDRYATLLPRLACRDDLTDLLGEVIGELATSHTYIWGGDEPRAAEHVATGLLGAQLTREGAAWKLTRIFRGDPADNAPSPLLAPGLGVKEGDYVLAVNHVPPRADRPFEAGLVGLADRPVVLTVNGTPDKKGARDIVVVPVADDGRLRYVDWVRRNREHVAAKTGGRVGYLHIPDMGAAGLVAFDTWYHPQLGLDGLVVDVRWNRGGFVSQLILERLRRSLLGYTRSRGGGLWTYPDKVLNAPFVVITNEFAGSDGDIFPTAVQGAKLAPVLGERSWGGVVGIRSDKDMVDGGTLTQPEYAYWFPGKGWGIENHGVDPDIVVTDFPHELAKGIDSQLDRAIAEVTRLKAEHPPIPAAFEAEPVKTREEFQKREAGGR